MSRPLATFLLSGFALTQIALVNAQTTPAQSQPAVIAADPAGNFTKLPAAPAGKSTIMGGQIRNVDPVRDQFSLLVYGERPMKILYDERTQIYRDGTRIALRELGPEDHASVQTVLDGTTVFALSIHILSSTPQGECQGQVVSFNPGTHELSVSSPLSSQPIVVQVPPDTLIARVGQSTFTADRSGLADLKQGALVSVKFSPVRQGQPVASQISVLAVPGSQFVLAGEITFLDLDSNLLDVVDPRDEKRYRVYFDPEQLPSVHKLHLGDHVRIEATYQAPRYVASDVAVEQPVK